MATITKTVAKAAKNIAAATALAAIKKKYGKPTPEPKPDDGERETAALVERLDTANRNLSMAVAKLVARAFKGGVQNSELIKLTDAISAVAKNVR